MLFTSVTYPQNLLQYRLKYADNVIKFNIEVKFDNIFLNWMASILKDC